MVQVRQRQADLAYNLEGKQVGLAFLWERQMKSDTLGLLTAPLRQRSLLKEGSTVAHAGPRVTDQLDLTPTYQDQLEALDSHWNSPSATLITLKINVVTLFSALGVPMRAQKHISLLASFITTTAVILPL